MIRLVILRLLRARLESTPFCRCRKRAARSARTRAVLAVAGKLAHDIDDHLRQLGDGHQFFERELTQDTNERPPMAAHGFGSKLV